MNWPTDFWTRRRAAVAEAAEAELLNAPREGEEAEAQAPPQPEEEVLAGLGLPDPDTLNMGDDFSAFMSKAVPAYLRKRALRRLWRSNPVLACVDGLNDYDDDYLTGSYGQGPVQTTYQVGKGLLAHILEVQRVAEPARQDTDEIAEHAPEEPAPEIEAVPEAHVDVAEVPADEDDTPRPRRMSFQFEGEAT